ncbi:methyltransferase domain-containing protein [Actinomadura sp. NPDC000600]|uniref:class I SAM-dependent methyltransferase n=1 Tax=Actinomadura sp. NPDC000600 TaxID=3154262 RepID=UPI0033938893
MWVWSPGKALFRSQEAILLGDETLPTPSVDLGCGNGEFATLLPMRITFGLDADLDRCRAAARGHVYDRVLCADLKRLPFGDGRLRSAISNSVLEHVDAPIVALTEIHRVLASGGSLRLTVPTPRKREWLYFSEYASASRDAELAERYRRLFDARWNHRRYYEAEDLHNLLRNCGFRDIEITEYEPRGHSQLSDMLSSVRIQEIAYGDAPIDGLVKAAWRGRLYELLLPILSAPAEAPGAGLFCIAVK